MFILILLCISPVFTDLPFAMKELMMTSPSNIIAYDVEEKYIEDIIIKIPGLSITEEKVYFYGLEVLVTKDGIPIKIGDVVPQSIERIEFLGESSIAYHSYPVLNFISQRFPGGLSESMVWVRTGDTLGFELGRGVFESGDIYISGRICETSIYEGNIGYILGKWKLRGYWCQEPFLELSSEIIKLRLSRDYQDICTYIKTNSVDIGFGAVMDSSVSLHISSKIELIPLLYLIPQIKYCNDSLSPKFSAGFIPYYEVILFGWTTSSHYGGGVRFRENSIFFQSPDHFGLLLQYNFRDNINIGMNYDNYDDRLCFFLKTRYPFMNSKIVPQIYITNNLTELSLRLIDVYISARIKGPYFPVFNLSWRFLD